MKARIILAVLVLGIVSGCVSRGTPGKTCDLSQWQAEPITPTNEMPQSVIVRQDVGLSGFELSQQESAQVSAMLHGLRNPRYYMPMDDCDGVFGDHSRVLELTLANGTSLTVILSSDGTQWEEYWGDKVGHGPVDEKLEEFLRQKKSSTP